MGGKAEGEQYDSDDAQRRDELLLRLLKTPPQPRPKRDRGEKPSDRPEKRGPAAKREPSA